MCAQGDVACHLHVCAHGLPQRAGMRDIVRACRVSMEKGASPPPSRSFFLSDIFAASSSNRSTGARMYAKTRSPGLGEGCERARERCVFEHI